MALSKSPNEHKIPEANQDLISTLPTDVTEKILKLLPLKMVARTSVLSTKWRQNWLSHSYLIFDVEFWDGQRTKNGKISWHKISNIISNVLFHHNGPIHTFHLIIPHYVDQVKSLNLSQWLSFLSRNGIKEIRLENWFKIIPMPCHLFACKDIEKLHINGFELMPQPSSFQGFASLRCLELYYAEHSPDTFRRLIVNCPRLLMLKVETLNSLDLHIIDVSSLEHLDVVGNIESFSFKDATRLKSISLEVYISKENSLELFNFLIASSRVLQNLHLDGRTCELMAAAGITTRLNLAFGHLHTLTLSYLNLGDSRVFRFTIGLIQNSPFIKDLNISVSRNTSVVQHQFYYDENCKLRHLRNVEIEGLNGSTAELKFIEHLLAISLVHDKLVIIMHRNVSISELEVLQELLQLPRSSTKAKLIYIRQ